MTTVEKHHAPFVPALRGRVQRIRESGRGLEVVDTLKPSKKSRSGCCTTENHEVPASLGLFLPTDFVVFKVEADFFQVQTPYAQQPIEIASIIFLVCHHEACLRAKLFFPQASVRD